MNQLLQKGQIGLIVVLIMAVGLTIGLAVASQSLTDISITETEKQSLRAFNAAEAGIEATLQQEGTLTGGLVDVGDLQAAVTVSDSTNQTITLNRNETAEVNLTGATAHQITIKWTVEDDLVENPGACEEGEGKAPASIEIVRINVDETGPSKIIRPYRTLYNSSTCHSVDLGSNNFLDSNVGTAPYLSEATIAVDPDPGGSLYDTALRIRTFYNKATIQIEGVGGTLQTQQYQITSTATTDTGETRTIEVSKSVEAWPPIFDYTLFSGGTLEK